MNRLITFFISFVFLGIAGSFIFAKGAAAAQFYLAPASSSVQINNSITLDVRLDTQGTQTAIADIELNYDPAKLEFQSYSNTGSPLITALGLSGGGGTVIVTQYIPGSGTTPPTPTQGDILYGKVIFKALANSGTSVVSFGDGSVVYNFPPPNAGDPVATTGVSGTYTFTAPSVSPPPPPPPPPPPGSTNPPPPLTPPASSGETINSEGAETTNIPNSAGDTKAPTISDIKYTNLTDTSVVIEWVTDEAGTSYVNYGETDTYGLGNGDASYTKDHKVTLSNNLKATTKYNFQVLSSDQAGNTAFSKNQTFTTKPPVEVQRTYRFVGLAMIIGGLAALGIIAFYYFRKKGPHPDNLTPEGPAGDPIPNLNPPI